MTVSIEARKYLGHNVVCLRSWDGYDKPQRKVLFKITEEEVDFENGRFNLFTYALKEVSQKFVIGIDNDTQPIENIINWIGENAEGFWHFDISDSIIECNITGGYFWQAWIFHFKNEEDCVKFTLRWM